MKFSVVFIKHIIPCLLFFSASVSADTLRVAVASNFAKTFSQLAQKFESSSGHKLKLIFGSTGKHYAQIINGAPFDVFFAADSKRPLLLEQQGFAITKTRFTYAVGKIILWSPRENYFDNTASILSSNKFRRLAIASPKLAPYGIAAQQVLKDRGLWSSLTSRMVRGENIAQTYQFIKSGNAELGFVALAQVKQANKPISGSFWRVPTTEYPPIKQQAVLLNDNIASRELLTFVRSKQALNIIHESGYDTP